jgi:hypothetical protein
MWTLLKGWYLGKKYFPKVTAACVIYVYKGSTLPDFPAAELTTVSLPAIVTNTRSVNELPIDAHYTVLLLEFTITMHYEY